MNYGENKDGFSFPRSWKWTLVNIAWRTYKRFLGKGKEAREGRAWADRYPAGYIIGSLSNEDDDGYENVTCKVGVEF